MEEMDTVWEHIDAPPMAGTATLNGQRHGTAHGNFYGGRYPWMTMIDGWMAEKWVEVRRTMPLCCTRPELEWY